jgi:hypothetical protein
MTSGVTDTPKSGEPSAAGELVWHTLGADQVLHSEGVDAQRGLTSSEAAARAERRPEHVRRWPGRVPLARVRAPVCGPDAARAARRRQPLPLKQLGTGLLLILRWRSTSPR